MDTVVWKHPLPNVVNTLDLSAGACVLHVAEQHGVPCLWEAHDASQAGTEKRTFELAGTGYPADVDPARCVGTVLMHGGACVFHVFETTPAP